jgi:hypothetical protein
MKRKPKKPDPNRYPPGLNARKVKALIEHYEKQSDEEAIAEADAAYERRTTSMIEVPNVLLPKIRRLISRAG